jgi:hypothetical protein
MKVKNMDLSAVVIVKMNRRRLFKVKRGKRTLNRRELLQRDEAKEAVNKREGQAFYRRGPSIGFALSVLR